MISRFPHFFLLGLFFFSLVLTAVPLPAVAASLIPCGRSGADATAAERAPCTICHIITGGQRIMDWGLRIMTFAAIAIIVAMAIFYIVSAGNEGMMTTAKSGIKAAFIGFAVMLGAWLIINTTLRIFSATIPGLVVTSNGFGFSCDTSSSAGSAQGTGTATGAVGASTGVALGTGGAACVDPDSEKLRMNSGGTVCNNSGSCPSCNTSAFDTFITSYGSTAGISLGFIRGLIARESSCVSTKEKSESNGTKSCGLMMVNTASSTYTCEQLKNPETGIREGVRILAAAFTSARSLSAQYGARVTVGELAAAIHNAGAGQSAASVDCATGTGWPTIPKWGCPINPGTAEFNACRIKDYACNVGACR